MYIKYLSGSESLTFAKDVDYFLTFLCLGNKEVFQRKDNQASSNLTREGGRYTPFYGLDKRAASTTVQQSHVNDRKLRILSRLYW